MTLMKKLIHLLAWSLLLTSFANAQISVTKSASGKTSIDLSNLRASGGAAAQEFVKTLERDLTLSGWFQVKRGQSELFVNGTAQNDGQKTKAVIRVYRRADQGGVFSKSYAIETARTRAMAHRVADDMIQSITGNKGIASTQIALVGKRAGSKELYLCDADGGNIRQVTKDRKIVVSPNWGPAGKNLIFTSYLRGFPNVYSIDLSSQRRSGLAGYPGLNTGADISPNGKEMAIILSKDGNPELYVKTLRTGALRNLSRTLRATEASPSWSPDGSQIVYVSDSSGSPQLYVISAAGGRPRRLSSRGTENVAPDWGANNRIACSSRSGGRYSIAIIDPINGQTAYLNTDAADYESPSWAPDGRHLVATRTSNYRSGIYLLDTLNDPPVALIVNGGDWLSPAWSPK